MVITRETYIVYHNLDITRKQTIPAIIFAKLALSISEGKVPSSAIKEFDKEIT